VPDIHNGKISESIVICFLFFMIMILNITFHMPRGFPMAFVYRCNRNKPDCDPYAMSEPAYLRLFREKLTQRAKMALKRNPFLVATSASRSN
jgi:hypothetical protein